MAVEEALRTGAMALFGEKYGEKVRVVMVSDFSIELCGGTHTSRTGDIGFFKMVSESGVAAGVRRIEALTGEGAYRFVKEEERELWEIASSLKSVPGELSSKIERLLERQRELERELSSFQDKAIPSRALESSSSCQRDKRRKSPFSQGGREGCKPNEGVR